MISNDSTFQIKIYFSHYTCLCREFHNRNVNSLWVAKKYLEWFRLDLNMKLNDVQELVKADYQVNISNSQTQS